MDKFQKKAGFFVIQGIFTYYALNLKLKIESLLYSMCKLSGMKVLD